MNNNFRVRSCIYGNPALVDKVLYDNSSTNSVTDRLKALDKYIQVINYDQLRIIDFKIKYEEDEECEGLDAYNAVRMWRFILESSERLGLLSEFIMLDDGCEIHEWNDCGSRSLGLLGIHSKITTQY